MAVVEEHSSVVFIELPNTKIELLYPLGQGSPIAGFLEKNPTGGIHHICYEVEDIVAARDRLKASGARVLPILLTVKYMLASPPHMSNRLSMVTSRTL